ncbi:Asp23/Gls24 family envelope stress response protein [Streptomyces sp. NPDC048606]|uniref:Asp23/Gls24 family envelope stress response protein n=1 Tax=Streptomyces sp. NPDC048606 TaxID=3154726 RepID=UPI003436B4A2
MAMNDPAHETGHHPHPAPFDDADAELLACGRDLAAVWEQAEEAAADPHTPGCAYCQEALADLRRLRAAALAPAVSPTGAPPDATALARRVMDVVRLELRPGRTLPLGERDEDTWIYESVAARTLRVAAEEVPGVRAGGCRVAPPDGHGPPRRGPVTVRLEVTVEFGRDLRAAAEAVRAAVTRAAQRRLGLELASVDVTVTDLHDPPDRHRESTA